MAALCSAPPGLARRALRPRDQLRAGRPQQSAARRSGAAWTAGWSSGGGGPVLDRAARLRPDGTHRRQRAASGRGRVRADGRRSCRDGRCSRFLTAAPPPPRGCGRVAGSEPLVGVHVERGPRDQAVGPGAVRRGRRTARGERGATIVLTGSLSGPADGRRVSARTLQPTGDRRLGRHRPARAGRAARAAGSARHRRYRPMHLAAAVGTPVVADLRTVRAGALRAGGQRRSHRARRPCRAAPATASGCRRRAASATRPTASSRVTASGVRRRARIARSEALRPGAGEPGRLMTDARYPVGAAPLASRSLSDISIARPKNRPCRREWRGSRNLRHARVDGKRCGTLHVSRRFAVVVRRVVPAQAAGCHADLSDDPALEPLIERERPRPRFRRGVEHPFERSRRRCCRAATSATAARVVSAARRRSGSPCSTREPRAQRGGVGVAASPAVAAAGATRRRWRSCIARSAERIG